jgi:hypothetical protein
MIPKSSAARDGEFAGLPESHTATFKRYKGSSRLSKPKPSYMQPTKSSIKKFALK